MLLVDGTLIATQRRAGRDNRKHSSGKHHRHGLYFSPLTDERGRLIWISAGGPGRTRDATAARHDHLVEHLKAADLGALADLGFLGVDKPDDPDDLVIVTSFKATRSGRAPVERGFAHLKNWPSLTKLRTDPVRATHLLRALLVLTNIEATTGS